MYKLIDRQGQGTFANKVFETKEKVYQHLLNYHEPNLNKEVVYELNDLLDIGDWELLEIQPCGHDMNRCSKDLCIDDIPL